MDTTTAAARSRTTTVRIEDADRGTLDEARGLDLRIGYDLDRRTYVRHQRRVVVNP